MGREFAGNGDERGTGISEKVNTSYYSEYQAKNARLLYRAVRTLCLCLIPLKPVCFVSANNKAVKASI